MFNSNHQIWKESESDGDMEGCLEYAEFLVNTLLQQNAEEIKFDKKYDLMVASYLLMDDLFVDLHLKLTQDLHLKLTHLFVKIMA